MLVMQLPNDVNTNTQIQKYKITKIYSKILAMQPIEPLKLKLSLLLVHVLRSNIFVLIILNWRDGGQKSDIFEKNAPSKMSH